MNSLTRTAVLTVGLCALAACSQPPGNTAGAGGGNTAVASAAPASASAPGATSAGGAGPAAGPAGATSDFAAPRLGQPITAADMPRVREGLWRGTRTTNGGPPEPQSECSTGAPQPWNRGAAASSRCPPVFHRTLTGGYYMEIACSGRSGAGMTVRQHIEGDPNSHMVMDSEMRGSGRLARFNNRSHVEMSYAGPCPAGSSPGA